MVDLAGAAGVAGLVSAGFIVDEVAGAVVAGVAGAVVAGVAGAVVVGVAGFTLPFLLLAAGSLPHAIPRALRPKTADNTNTFVILVRLLSFSKII